MGIKEVEEAKIRIFPDLNGRGEFDLLHTKVALEYADKYQEEVDMSLDWLVLRIALVAHDWGYLNQFKPGEGGNLKEIAKRKDTHMIVGAQKLSDLLKKREFEALTKSQKERAVHLVSVHDRLDQLKDRDEFILMELDTLGGLSISNIPRYLEIVRDIRLPKFITEYGKDECSRLLESKKSLLQSTPA